MKRFLLALSIITFLFSKAGAQSNQTVTNGAATTAVNFPGTGCVYNWVNDTPGIGLAASGTGNIASFTAVNTGNSPVTATITATPTGGFAYVPNSGDSTVSVVNTATNAVVSTITVGSFPFAVAASPDGSRVYIANEYSSNVSVINTADNTVTATVTVGTYPNGAAVSPDGTRAYITNNSDGIIIGDNTVSVINTLTNSVIATIPVGPNPLGVSVSPDGAFVYVANSNSNTVSVIQTSTNAVSATITVGIHPFGVCFSPDGSRAYVTNHDAQNVAVINTATQTVIGTVTVGLSPYGICSSPDGKYLYVANLNDNTVSVINTASNSVTSTIPVGVWPYGICISPDGNSVYVVTRGINSISTINTATNTITASTMVGSNPYSFGNFFVGTGCSPVKFTITVNPAATPLPVISASTATGTITACTGTASSSPNIQQFTVSGSNLSYNITATAPAGFEVSLSAGSGFGSNVMISEVSDSVSSRVVYVRSAASAPAGNVAGSVTLTSGPTTQNVAVNGIVNALPTINAVPNQTINGGAATAPVNFSGTANTFTWVNDTPGIGLAANGSGNIGAFTAVNSGSSPVTANVTVTPVSSGYAYINNVDDNDVSVISTATNTVVATIRVGTQPIGIAVTPDGTKVYITNSESNSVSVISTQTNTVIATIPVGTYPYSAAVSPDGSLAYIANANDGTISIINTSTNTVKATVKVGMYAWDIAQNADGSRLYISDYINSLVYVFDTPTSAVVATINTPRQPYGLCVSNDGTKVYVADETANSDSVLVINTATNTVISTISTDRNPYTMVESPDGKWLYVVNANGADVSVIDLSTNLLTVNIPVGGFPESLSITSDGRYLYVPGTGGSTTQNVSVIDTKTNTVIALVPVGKAPISFGNFIKNGTGCTGTPTTYTITVNPTLVSLPTITANAATGTISACAGTASASPNIQQFIVSGSNLTGNIIAAAPNNFEVSLSAGSGYADSVSLIQTGGTVSSTIVYVRSATEAPTGSISGNVALTSPGNVNSKVPVTGTVNALPTVNDPGEQTLYNGSVTAGIIFTGTGTTVTWTNDTPSIGLPATGTGNIASFTGINNTSSPVTATLAVTPINTAGCTGTVVIFTITVIPASTTVPTIAVGKATGNISACSGTASASPDIQQFTVSASNLTSNITATAPGNFEVSLSPASGYADIVALIPSGDSVSNVVVYVRSSASAPVGSISGFVTLSAAGLSSPQVAVTGFVNASPTLNPVPDQTVGNGATTTAVNFSGTANTINWVNDSPAIGLAASGSGNIAPFTAVNTGSSPVKATLTATPLSVGYAYIANSISNDVSVINTATNTIAYTIPVGNDPTGLSVSPDGSRVYVANQRSNTVSVISTTTNTVVSTITISSDSPTTVAVSPDGTRLYVVNLNSNNVSVINTATNALIASIGVGGYPVCVAVNPDGNTVYVVNSSNNISVIDVATNAIRTTIPVISPYGICLSPDGSKLYLSVLGASDVLVINTSTNAVIATIPVAPSPAGITISPDGSRIYVSNGDSNSVTVISTATNAVTATIPVGTNPTGISVSPDGALVYVANEQSNSVSVISTASNAIIATVNVGQYPVCLGNFVTGGTGCTGAPVTFTITVNPLSITPFIAATGSDTSLTAVYGTASSSSTFTVSGRNLTAGILFAAPAGYEVSTDNISFSKTVTVGGSANTISVQVYVRLAATTPVGTYNGEVVLSSPGAVNFSFELPTGTVTPAPLTITADNKMKIYGTPNPVLTVSYAGFVNNDGPAQLTNPPILITSALTTSPAGLYPITASGAGSPNYTITYFPGTLTIVTDSLLLVIPNAFTPNGDGINDTWDIQNIGNYPNCTVNIFNRWGGKVFSSVGYGVPWDGKYGGANLPQGTYYYIINLQNANKIFSGDVLIIR